MKYYTVFFVFLSVFLCARPVAGQFQVRLTEDERALMEVPQINVHEPFVMADAELPDIPSSFPGETTPIVYSYKETNAPNQLYLASLPHKLWWNDQAAARLPVLVTEPAGLARRNQPVSVMHRFPSGAKPESIRVVTPYGSEIPSQTRILNEDTLDFEVVFLLDRLDASQHVPLFIYYGDRKVDVPGIPMPDLSLRIEERENSVILINSSFFAEFSKISSRDAHPVWRDVRGRGMEFNLISAFPVLGYEDSAHGVQPGAELKILEDGPVRKTVSYGEWGKGYTVSVYANSPLAYINSTGNVQSFGFWLPGGDTLNDVLAYASPEGLKRMPIEYAGANTEPYTYSELRRWLSEGWFALLDQKHDGGVGWFFDLSKARIFLQTVGYGYWVGLMGPGRSALYIADDSKTESCRSEYIAWKYPPLITVGKTQPFEKIEPQTPVFGRDFIRMHFVVERFHPRTGSETAGKLVEKVLSFGGNYIFFLSPRNAWLEPSVNFDGSPAPAMFDELVGECRARGMGLAGYSGWNVNLLRDMVSRGIDGVFLADEWGWGLSTDYYPLNEEARKQFLAGTGGWGHVEFSREERDDFKKRYGVEMPDEYKTGDELDDILQDIEQSQQAGQGLLDTAAIERELQGRFPGMASTNLNDPSQLALFRMMMDANNIFMSDLADVARENNTNVFVSTVTSPVNLVIPHNLSATHDLETLADSFSSVCLDLYSNDGGWLNGIIKYARGVQGNRQPLFIISGYAGWDDRDMSELNQHLQIMYGANSLCYFVLDRVCTPWHTFGVRDAFNFIDYSGLGDFVAKAWPLEFAGVLRDRDELLASLERGETLNKYGFGSLYEGSIFQTLESIALGFDIPVNMISARHLEKELEAPYKLIFVPNNPTLSDVNAALLRDFVKAGGHLIVENACIENSIIADMAGVSPAGKRLSGDVRIEGVKPPLENWSAETTCAWQPVKTGPEVEVLATIAGSMYPAVTMTKHGAGSVIYIAPRIGPRAKSANISRALRALVAYVAGPLPIKVEPGDSGWTTVLTDGERYVVCIYNDSDQPRENVTMILNGFGDSIKGLVSLRTGVYYPVVDGIAHSLRVPARKPEYFMSVSR